MEISTFSLFESARRGLTANQTALNVVSQNISNASVDGYTRQEAILKSTAPVAYGNNVASNIGTGVEVSEIRQIRDMFIDSQVRVQEQISKYWSTKQDYLERIQTFMADTTNGGIGGLLDKFWKAAEDLSNSPQSQSTRQALIHAGESLTSSVSYISTQIDSIQKSIDGTISEDIQKVNNLSKRISEINTQIMKFEKTNFKMNDLRDERTRLINELSSLVQVNVLNAGTLDDGYITLNGHPLVSEGKYNELEAVQENNGLYNIKWKNEADKFSSNRSVATGSALSTAASGIYNLDVKSLASGFKVSGSMTGLEKNGLLSKIDGLRGGSISVNGREVKVDPAKMTVSDLINAINQSAAGVTASLDDVGRMKITSNETGVAADVELKDVSSNLFEKLGLTSSISGTPVPKIKAADESLNISGSFTVNGVRISVIQGQTDSLNRIVSEINTASKDAAASLVVNSDGSYGIRVAAKDGYSKVEISDSDGNLLRRLGLLNSAGTASSSAAVNVTKGTDARFFVNNTEYVKSSNLVNDAIKGASIQLNGTGTSQIDVKPAVTGGEIGALLEVRDETIPEYFNKLGEFVKKFSSEFNDMHQNGFDLNGEGGKTFFNVINYDSSTSGKQILKQFEVSQELKNDPSKLAAAGLDEDYYAKTGIMRSKGSGDNTVALEYTKLKNKAIFEDGTTVTDKYADILSSVGDIVSSAQKNTKTQESILKNLEAKKESISGVSIDEEVTNMLKFQYSYNASAKVINVIDGIMDTIVNKLMR